MSWWAAPDPVTGCLAAAESRESHAMSHQSEFSTLIACFKLATPLMFLYFPKLMLSGFGRTYVALALLL